MVKRYMVNFLSITRFLLGFPFFITHFSVTLSVLLIALFLYMLITPHNEIELIKKGNTAAAISLGGVFLGLAIPLSVCLKSSVSLADITQIICKPSSAQLTEAFLKI
jgi:putative membrane protein